MKFYAIIFTIIFLNTSAQSQTSAAGDSSFIHVKTLEADIAEVAIDYLDNVYIISSAGQVKKISIQGDSMAVYNQSKNYGQLTVLDVSNPLKPLLFYKDFASVVILDRFLAQRAVVDLKKLNILQPSAIGLSYDNNLWVFDEYDNRLKKVDEQGNTLFQSADFRTLFANSFSPQKIYNEDGFVYLADTAQGILVFDNYGTFKRKISLNSWNSISFIKDLVITAAGDRLMVYQPSTLRETFLNMTHIQRLRNTFISRNRFVTFSNDRLHIYHFKF